MWRLESSVRELKVWQQGGNLLKEATTRIYKQRSTKSELSEVCCSGGRAWPTGAQLVKWGRIPGVTLWSDNPLGHIRMGGT